ncbi:MAG: SpoIIIAH-like family protein [Oscillospiraceae bacterium]|jgi:stage III sporulation protein AH|nr:SpoIIIAH-like family protein [Oscillospiraceae bacterium]
MKLFKRNAIILTVIAFVCAAVYLNWAYNRPEDIETNASDHIDATETQGLFYDGAESVGADEFGLSQALTVSEYFANARLARQQARDSAVNILRQNGESDNVSEEVRDRSMASISAMAEYSLSEAEIESLVRAKGFDECVVFLSDNSITITVPAPPEGLAESAVARITDVVITETDIGYEQIKIVEVK